MSLVLFYALDPVVHHLTRWRVPRPFAALLVVLAFVGGIGAGGWVLWPQIEQVVDDIPQGAADLRRELRSARGGEKTTLQRVQEAAKAIDAAAAEAASPPARVPGVTQVEVRQPTRTTDWLWSGGAGALTLAGQTLTVFFLTIFLLSEGDSFKRKFVRHMQTRGSQRVTVKSSTTSNARSSGSSGSASPRRSSRSWRRAGALAIGVRQPRCGASSPA